MTGDPYRALKVGDRRELGAHSEALLYEIGYSAEAIADLRAWGIAQ